MSGNGAGTCPACGAAVVDAWCGECGLELGGAEAGELRSLAARLEVAEESLKAVWAQRDALAKELSTRQWARTINATSPPTTALRGWQRPAMRTSSTSKPQTPRYPPGEWTVDRIRNLLLWAGAALLALSALAFTAVAWTHLGPGGRALLLVVITIIAALGAIAARDRLPATSSALTGLAIALALIDWQIVRRAGAAPGLSSTAWWAIGTAVVGGASLALGQVAATTAQRAVAILLPTSAVLAITAGASSTWSGALLLSLLAAALVAVPLVAHERMSDPIVRTLLRLEAGATWIVGAVIAIDAAAAAHTFAQTLTPATVVLSFALAPALVLALSSAGERDRALPASLVLAAIAGAAMTLASTAVGPIGLMTLAVVLGSVAIAAVPLSRGVWPRAAMWTGAVVATPGIVYAGFFGMLAEAGPLAWLSHAWTGSTGATATHVVAGPVSGDVNSLGWCVVGIVVCIALALASVLRPRATERPQLWPAVPVGGLLVAGAMAPLAAGASVGVTCAVVTALAVIVLLASAVIARDDDAERALLLAALALLPAVPAAGWAATTSSLSITVLAAAVVAATVAAVIARIPSLRAADAALASLAAVGLAAVIALAAGTSAEAAGFTIAIVAGAIVVFGSQVRFDTADGIALEATGLLGIVGGAALAASSPEWLAASLTAAVPLLLAAGLRGHRTLPYGVAAGCAALGATWAWLSAADVTVVEAYTLPAAVLALGLGSLARRDGPAHSWLTLGPAVVLALAPTLAITIANGDDGRAIAVGLAALVVVLFGARERLQAPIVLGTAALVILGVDKFGPTAVRLPRWLMLAFVGSVLLWVGTTFERRRDDALRAARRFEQLG